MAETITSLSCYNTHIERTYDKRAADKLDGQVFDE